MTINTQYGANVSSKKIRIKNPKELKCALVTQNFKRGIWHLKLESAIIALFFSFALKGQASHFRFLNLSKSFLF